MTRAAPDYMMEHQEPAPHAAHGAGAGCERTAHSA